VIAIDTKTGRTIRLWGFLQRYLPDGGWFIIRRAGYVEYRPAKRPWRLVYRIYKR
jgi:hypothetical protein